MGSFLLPKIIKRRTGYMSKIKWDETGERLFETAVENGALICTGQ